MKRVLQGLDGPQRPFPFRVVEQGRGVDEPDGLVEHVTHGDRRGSDPPHALVDVMLLHDHPLNDFDGSRVLAVGAPGIVRRLLAPLRAPDARAATASRRWHGSAAVSAGRRRCDRDGVHGSSSAGPLARGHGHRSGRIPMMRVQRVCGHRCLALREPSRRLARNERGGGTHADRSGGSGRMQSCD